MIVGSFTSVALDPPQVMFSADTQSRLHDIIVRNGCFAVSILAAHQTDLLARFGGIDRSHDRQPVRRPQTETHITGCPVLPDSVAWVDCRMADLHRGEGSAIFIGTVVAASLGKLCRGLADGLLPPRGAWSGLIDVQYFSRANLACGWRYD